MATPALSSLQENGRILRTGSAYLLSQDNLRGKKIIVANFKLKNLPQVADLLAEGGNFLNSRTAVRGCFGCEYFDGLAH